MFDTIGRHAPKLAVAGAALLAAALAVPSAQASHFRGAAMVPSVSASGLLTVTSTSFWRKTAGDSSFTELAPSVSGVGGMTETSSVMDTSDARFNKRTQTHTRQLPGDGAFGIIASSCCRVSGIANASAGTFTMNSTIAYDGATANAPILFDFSAIQPEVVRGSVYSDNLGAASGNAGTLSYDQALNTSISSQPPGFTVSTTTGALAIPAASTAGYVDNGSNLGADYAFSGNIFNTDGSKVEFDWMFDAVDSGAINLAPDVSDHFISAVIGDTISQVVTGTDANGADTVTLSLLSFFGPSIGIAPSFTATAGNPASGTFLWNSTGSTAGTYIANIRGSDGSLVDVGTTTILLSAAQGGVLPEPGTLAIMGMGLMGLGFSARRRRSKEK